MQRDSEQLSQAKLSPSLSLQPRLHRLPYGSSYKIVSIVLVCLLPFKLAISVTVYILSLLRVFQPAKSILFCTLARHGAQTKRSFRYDGLGDPRQSAVYPAANQAPAASPTAARCCPPAAALSGGSPLVPANCRCTPDTMEPGLAKAKGQNFSKCWAKSNFWTLKKCGNRRRPSSPSTGFQDSLEASRSKPPSLVFYQCVQASPQVLRGLQSERVINELALVKATHLRCITAKEQGFQP